jgi:dihydrofolate reductase
MRKLVLKMSVSVDGFVGGPNGEIDWIFRTLDENVTAWILDTLWQAGVHIMGSRTFHDMTAYWPRSREPLAAPMNEIPKVVFSRKGFVEPARAELTTAALRDASRSRTAQGLAPSPAASRSAATWADARVASGDLAEEITGLKQQPGRDILAHGGARFAQSLARLGLIDEYRLVVHPVALGKGLPLFFDLPKPIDFKLVSTTPFGNGVVAQVYQPG